MIRRVTTVTAATLLAAAMTTPALAEQADAAGIGAAGTVEWEHHWIRHAEDGFSEEESHTVHPDGARTFCGGYRYSGYDSETQDVDWVIHHSHAAPTFTVASGGHIEISSWHSFAGENSPSSATFYVELERDYTTGEHYPDESDRPRFYTKYAWDSGSLDPVSIDLSDLAGHQVKLQFRCEQPGHPGRPTGFDGFNSGTGFYLGSFTLPAA